MEKKNLFLTGILAIVLIFSFALTGCGEPDSGDKESGDPKWAYNGTWKEMNAAGTDFETGQYAYELDISNTEIVFSLPKATDNTQGWKGNISGNWKYITKASPDPDFVEYSIGFKITVTLTEKKGNLIKNDGTTSIDIWGLGSKNVNDTFEFIVFVNKLGDRLILGKPDGESYKGASITTGKFYKEFTLYETE
jgi:hypothetical protein